MKQDTVMEIHVNGRTVIYDSKNPNGQPICPFCAGRLLKLSRKTDNSKFLGCENYNHSSIRCRYTIDLKQHVFRPFGDELSL